MDISYAQNLEDYHLARIFAGRASGFYIDVGAGHPVVDNVSFWFYTQGWRGIVVEPQRDLIARYPRIRPRDVAVGALLGREPGEAAFHVVDRLHGFSTMIERHAAGAAAFGAGYRTERRPVTTLAALCASHGVGEIDFLKIDVEGAEGEVLAGADWRRFRPKVVVVEAVAPGTMAEAWGAWEPALVAAGYRFAFFDKLNRFYLAEEAEDLAARIPGGETPWDVVKHFYEFGPAPDDPHHPDHALGRALVEGLLAGLPDMDTDVLRALLDGAAKQGDPGAPGIGSDAFRAALGRIAARFDGGMVEED